MPGPRTQVRADEVARPGAHLRRGPSSVGTGRAVATGKGNREGPPGESPGSLPPRAGHSLGYAGADEGHSNSATRRATDFIGNIRSTPPCDGNVLAPPPGQVPQAEWAGCRRLPSNLRARGTWQRLSSARRRGGVGPGKASGRGPPPSGPAPVRMLARRSAF